MATAKAACSRSGSSEPGSPIARRARSNVSRASSARGLHHDHSEVQGQLPARERVLRQVERGAQRLGGLLRAVRHPLGVSEVGEEAGPLGRGGRLGERARQTGRGRLGCAPGEGAGRGGAQGADDERVGLGFGGQEVGDERLRRSVVRREDQRGPLVVRGAAHVAAVGVHGGAHERMDEFDRAGRRDDRLPGERVGDLGRPGLFDARETRRPVQVGDRS
ncbi:hypothetical protein [Actinoallomurus acanthiterrae]